MPKLLNQLTLHGKATSCGLAFAVVLQVCNMHMSSDNVCIRDVKFHCPIRGRLWVMGPGVSKLPECSMYPRRAEHPFSV